MKARYEDFILPRYIWRVELAAFWPAFLRKNEQRAICALSFSAIVSFHAFQWRPILATCPGKAGVTLLILLIYHPAGTGNGTLFLCPSTDSCQKARSLGCGLHFLPFSQGPQLIYLLCIFYSSSPLHALSPHSKIL